ncbi:MULTISPECIES: hypothetical protein [unclassified Schlesneria]|uniref:hypothetical protein n=1 Tax=unclassified Schlesneria TaxID=2762017 RepID=UPI002F00C3A4
MARLIGMDEAGLGPNLGPFVVAVTVWDVPGSPTEFDFWKTFKSVLTNAPEAGDARLHVADSKQVFQPKRGFAALERGVLAALKMIGHEPDSFEALCEALSTPCPLIPPASSTVPWYCHLPQQLPFEQHDLEVSGKWRTCCERKGVRLVAIKVAIVEAHDFNRLLRLYDNKSLVVSRVAFQLLRSVWSPDETETFIVGDKHGGRNRYDQLLSEVLDGDMIFRLAEGEERSDYRVGKSLLRFQPRAEEHGPVALASMTAKYVRELAMARFNSFWSNHQTGLKPTQGYPLDARRFRDDIAETQRKLAISDDILWRSR